MEMKERTPIHDPKHWLQRAEATRAKAQGLADEGARQRLLRVAQEYERLAEHAEQWLTVQRDKPSEVWLLQGTTVPKTTSKS